MTSVSDLDKSKGLRSGTILSSDMDKFGVKPLHRKDGNQTQDGEDLIIEEMSEVESFAHAHYRPKSHHDSILS